MASHSAVAARVAPESFYDWAAQDQSVSVSISLNLVDLLSLEMIEAFKSIPRRGLEIGGLLLGRVDTTGEKPVVVIEDRELAPSEHLHGPSFRLSSQDRDQLTALAAKWSAESNANFHVVGLFRGDTRPEHKFDEQDITLAKQLLPDGQGIFLMVAPATGHIGQATIGILKDGAIEPAGEFPFRSASLREGGREGGRDGGFPIAERSISKIAVERRAPLPPPPPPAEERPSHAAPPPSARVMDLAPYRMRTRRKNWPILWSRVDTRKWIPLSIAAGVVCAALFGTVWKRRASESAMAGPAVIAATAPGSSLTPIHLNVRRDGTEWNLSWNHTSELLAQAERGALQIHDGATNWELPLDRNELRTGSIRYLPKSGQVKFQLQVFTSDRTVSESIIALDSGYQPDVVQPAKGAADRGPRPPQQRTRKAKQDIERRPAPALQAMTSTTPASRHIDVAALPDPPALSPSPLVPAPGPALARESSPNMHLAVTTLFEPVGPSRLRKAFNYVSPTRLMRRRDDAVVAAKPIREVKPQAPLLSSQGSYGSTEVDVRVAIDTHGHVSGAWLESPKDSGPLSDAAMAAARNWRFAPASKNLDAVESEGLLHFRFQNPDVAAVQP